MPSLIPIAWTGNPLVGFAPYVPAIDDDGSVVFQAQCADGSNSIVLSRSGVLETVASTGSQFSEFVSHPDIDASGAIVWYAIDSTGKTALLKAHRGSITSLHAEGARLGRIGPLGPTADDGAVAFRANLPDGTPAVFLANGDELTLVAAARGEIVGFQGLPVVAGGSVLFRSDRADRGATIDLWREGDVERIAATGGQFTELGRFPLLTPGGVVAFVATMGDGSHGVFAGRPGQIEALPLDSAAYESLRGLLVTDKGHMWFYATPHGVSLGIYCSVESTEPILAIGRPFDGSPVAEFALNPVSINRHGQLAVRLLLDDGRHAIVRIEP